MVHTTLRYNYSVIGFTTLKVAPFSKKFDKLSHVDTFSLFVSYYSFSQERKLMKGPFLRRLI